MGLSKSGLKVLAQDCPRLPTTVVMLHRKFPLKSEPQMCTIVDDCAQIAESGLKPPFESSHLDSQELNPQNSCESRFVGIKISKARKP